MFLWFRKHSKAGLEIPDPTPIEVNLSSRPLTLAEQIARFTSSAEVQEVLRKRGMDTFDEADDFDTGDLEADDFKSPYEEEFNGKEVPLKGVQTRLDEQRGGMAEEMPFDRKERAEARLRPVKTEDKQAEAVKAQ